MREIKRVVSKCKKSDTLCDLKLGTVVLSFRCLFFSQQ